MTSSNRVHKCRNYTKLKKGEPNLEKLKNCLDNGGHYSLFGVACGDALGGTLEFMSKDEIERKYGYLKDIIGGGCWDLAPGEVTDDTMMTIAVAEGILDNPENPIEDIGKHFIKWYDGKPAYSGTSGRRFRRHPDSKPETSGHLVV